MSRTRQYPKQASYICKYCKTVEITLYYFCNCTVLTSDQTVYPVAMCSPAICKCCNRTLLNSQRFVEGCTPVIATFFFFFFFFCSSYKNIYIFFFYFSAYTIFKNVFILKRKTFWFMTDSRGGGAQYLHVGGLADRRACPSNKPPYLSGTKVEKITSFFE